MNCRRRSHHPLGISGRSVRTIANARRVTVSTINEAIDRWAASVIHDKVRKNALALELARLDELQETFHARALDGDVQCAALVTEIIARRCIMIALRRGYAQHNPIFD